jgi:pilus assembly protein CpaE
MRVILASESSAVPEAVRQTVNGLGLECAASDCVSYNNLRMRLAQSPAPDVVLVLTGANPADAVPAVQYAASYAGGPVFVAAPPDPTSREELQRAGARRCLDPGRLREELVTALDRLEQNGTVKASRGRPLVVTSAHPGVGVTTTALNLAFALGATNPGRVMLAELGSGVPELALALDLDVRHSLADLIRNWERSDPVMVRQVAIAHAAGVQVLAYPAATLSGVETTPTVLRHLLVLTRSMFDFLVLDLGHGASAGAVEAMQLAEAVFVVVRPDVVSLRLTRAHLLKLRDVGVQSKVRLVVNRSGYRQQIDRKEAETVLGMPTLEWVPDDPATVIKATNEGKPLVQYDRRAKVTRSFDRLTQSLASPAK